jgi:hypothetical protein
LLRAPRSGSIESRPSRLDIAKASLASVYTASNIGGVMLRGRPTPFDRAFVEPKQRRFCFIL